MIQDGSVPVQKVHTIIRSSEGVTDASSAGLMQFPQRKLTADQHLREKRSKVAVSHHTLHTGFNLWKYPY
jgi:hypothetical protein